ncbi:MAG TPA: hypothetical protein VF782_04385 [Allosphingosinicella sp.]
MAANPVQIQLNPFVHGAITCLSKASYFQRVTLTLPTGQVVFQGTGENVPMTYATGQGVYELGSSAAPINVTALFEYSTSGPSGPFYTAQVQDPVPQKTPLWTIVTVTSEDSTDNDDNDSILSLFVMDQ